MISTHQITQPLPPLGPPAPHACCWYGCGFTRFPVLVTIVHRGWRGSADACQFHAAEMSTWSSVPDWFKATAREG